MDKDSPTDRKGSLKDRVGASVPVAAIVATGLAVLLVIAGLLLYRALSREEPYPPIAIATGPDTGTYHALGSSLQRVLLNTGKFSAVELKNTDGSVENMRLIRSTDSGIDLAFTQGDASPSTNARLLTALYEEVLHIMISTPDAQDIRTIYDLEGMNVSLGLEDSGTRELSQRVLQHFGVTVGQDFIMSPSEAAQALTEESIDAAFLLTAIPSRLVAGLAERDLIRFLSLGNALANGGDEAHALELVFPGIRREVIPRSTYIRLPRDPVYTVGVSALLVARKNLDENVVRDITDTIFGYRAGESGLEGQELAVARKIREDYDPAANAVPYHAGAIAYYNREEPPFFVEYAEALSLGITLLLGLYSVFIALREWLRRRMKNRVDAYLVQVDALSSNFPLLSREQLHQRQSDIEQLRRAAFADLVAEKLLADEAFIILQNHLRDELGAIHARLEELEKEKRD